MGEIPLTNMFDLVTPWYGQKNPFTDKENNTKPAKAKPT